MKLTTLLILFCAMQLSASVIMHGQVTLKVQNESIRDVFREIETQSPYRFFYNEAFADLNKRISINVDDKDINSTLDELLLMSDKAFKVLDNNLVVIAPRKELQQQMVTGRVLDATTGEGLPGASVIIRGTTTGTTTDVEGNFVIDVPGDDAILVVSYLGYVLQEIIVGTNTVINISLVEDARLLDEIVVIGFGTQRRVSITSAVDAVRGEELVSRPSVSLTHRLQGVLPGLTIIDRGGMPGRENVSMRIRGVTTLANNNPLIIVDGIEQSFEQISPEDIESVSLLKDAASTAIYGSRAANGVILITTKRGTQDQTNVSYNGYVSFQNVPIIPEHIDTESYLRLQNLAFQNRGSAPIYSEEDIQNFVEGSDRLKYPLPNDWYNIVLQDNTPMTNHVFTVSGGTEIMQTLASVNYFNQEGIFPNYTSKRMQGRINNDLKVSDNITFMFDASYRQSTSSNPHAPQNIFHRMNHSSQLTVPIFPDGTYGMSRQNQNPLAWTDPAIAGLRKQDQDYLTLNSRILFSIADNLRYTFQYGYTNSNTAQLINFPTYEIRDYWNPNIVRSSRNINSLEEQRTNNIQTTWNNYLNYDLKLEDHEINVLAGFSQIANDNNFVTAFGRNFYNNDIRSLGQSEQENRNINSNYTDWRLNSFFGRINYSLLERYLLEFNMRYDGSSRFPRGNRYTLFPSISGAWRISEEAFFANLRDLVTDLKVRASWGLVGNQNIGLYTYFENLHVGNYYVFNESSVQGVRQNVFASQDLTWETTDHYNLGLDLGLLENRLVFTFDYFNKQTKDILLNLPIPGTVGLNPSATNAGQVENVGWEAQIRWRDRKSDFGYDLSLNFSDVKNKVINLAGTGPYYSGERNLYIIKEGLPIDALWGFRANSLLTMEDIQNNYPTIHANPHAGDIKYLDLNSDGIINDDDKDYLGSIIPRYTFMFNGNLNYRNIDLNIQLQGVGKVDWFITGAFTENGNWEGFMLDYGSDYWTPDNLNARFPRPNKQSNHNTTYVNEWWVVDGSYLRLKNIQIGYTIPANISNNLKLTSTRLYVSGTNLLTISKLNKWGLDAEAAPGRGDYYPQTSLYTIGLNVVF